MYNLKRKKLNYKSVLKSCLCLSNLRTIFWLLQTFSIKQWYSNITLNIYTNMCSVRKPHSKCESVDKAKKNIFSFFFLHVIEQYLQSLIHKYQNIRSILFTSWNGVWMQMNLQKILYKIKIFFLQCESIPVT